MTLHLVEGLVLKFGEQKAFLCQVCTWQWSHILVFWATFSGALGRRDSCKILQVNHLKRFVIWSTLPNKYERNFSQATTTTAKHLALNICISFLGVCECSGWESKIFLILRVDSCTRTTVSFLWSKYVSETWRWTFTILLELILTQFLLSPGLILWLNGSYGFFISSCCFRRLLSWAKFWYRSVLNGPHIQRTPCIKQTIAQYVLGPVQSSNFSWAKHNSN